MRVTALSGDMVLKAALVLAAVGAVAYVVHKVTSAAGDAAHAAAEWAQNTVVPALDITSDTNLAARATNAVGGAIASTAGPTAAGMNANGSWSLGGFAFDILHPNTAEAVRGVTGAPPAPPLYASPEYAPGAWG